MDVCVKFKIPITEEMAERLTPPKNSGIDAQERTRLLEKMGECCMLQGNYHLSAKKFTQAGNKVSYSYWLKTQ
jgi:intraflagellar transport protein 140